MSYDGHIIRTFMPPPVRRRLPPRPSVFFLGCLLVAGGAWATTYKSGRNRAAFPSDVTATTAYKLAQLDRSSCLRELARRDIQYQIVAEAPGVRAPVRLKGALNGIRFSTGATEAERARLPWEVLDCRLVLALHEWTRVLAAHDVSEVVFSSGWRPSKALSDGGGEGKRHSGALALDVHAFRLRSGGELVVERDFHGRIDAPVCGPDAPPPNPNSLEARQLRSLLCSSAELRVFQSILTPNYDVHHANHFHVEVVANVRWFILS